MNTEDPTLDNRCLSLTLLHSAYHSAHVKPIQYTWTLKITAGIKPITKISFSFNAKWNGPWHKNSNFQCWKLFIFYAAGLKPCLLSQMASPFRGFLLPPFSSGCWKFASILCQAESEPFALTAPSEKMTKMIKKWALLREGEKQWESKRDNIAKEGGYKVVKRGGWSAESLSVYIDPFFIHLQIKWICTDNPSALLLIRATLCFPEAQI